MAISGQLLSEARTEADLLCLFSHYIQGQEVMTHLLSVAGDQKSFLLWHILL